MTGCRVQFGQKAVQATATTQNGQKADGFPPHTGQCCGGLCAGLTGAGAHLFSTLPEFVQKLCGLTGLGVQGAGIQPQPDDQFINQHFRHARRSSF